MMSEAIIHGIILAFGLIIPLGVQNVFVFNQGASQPNIWRAAPVVLTASICDTLLILIAVQGVSLVLLTFSWLTNSLYIIGFFFLLYMGFVIWRSSPSNDVTQEKSMPLKKQILFAASVSLLNPHAILDTIGVIGTNSIHTCNYYRFLDLVYKLSFSGEISKKTRLNRKDNFIIK